MDSGTLSGIVTAILIVLFLGVWVWAYSSRRREQFSDALFSRLASHFSAPSRE